MAIKRCKSPFTIWVNGIPRTYSGGQLVEDSDPVLKSHGHLFEDVEAVVAEKAERAAQVEQATAAPGEKRSVQARAPRAAKAAAKKPDDKG